MSDILIPPVAKIIPQKLEIHNDVRIDNYYWLNDRENQDVIDYLNAENAYYEQMTAHTKDFQNKLFQEMKARIKEDESSVPYLYNGYWYITRFEKGGDYPIYSRKKESLEAPEEILFNCNEMAKNFAYFQLGGVSVSPNNKFATFGTDTVSRRIYTIQIKNLETGEILTDKIENCTGGSIWANDNQTIFYTTKDPVTLRSNKVYKHKIGTNVSEDVLVFEEKDETFSVYIYKEKSKKYLVIGSQSTMTTEYQYLNADTPDESFLIFQKRTRGLEYTISHFGNNFYILTNKDNATNFKLMKTSETTTSKENWVDVLPHREDVLLEDIEIFKDYLVVEERSNGLTQLRIIPWSGAEAYYLPFESQTYTAYTSTNVDFDTEILRYGYQSLKTPSSIIDFNMRTQEKEIKKEQEVLGGTFDKENYEEKRVWATARDGVKVPISLVYKKGIELNAQRPLLQYAYGSYGYSMDCTFSTTRLSLLDRGFIYAIAHIRGGEDLGRPWYEDGKLLKKKNTFTDFIDCSKFLIENKYTSAQHLYAEGGSAGGLLMGAVINMNPELYNGIISAVPFVDVVTTMLDDSIPLTTGEYDEWGNPKDKEYYDYMKSYSPYDNVESKEYPNMLVTTGLHDSQVQYWEPAKWVAKLRASKTDKNLLFLDTNMDTGHGGASGRFEALKEIAKEFSFLFQLEGIKR
ncbi:S9 family peptidase [Flavobacterium columnare]|uniref:S9 family peptidase n=1 Tax=Flavobacterium columnare TaxID=996 RepID=UPI0007F9BB54|nr:S9 family peptidase [Flavobacterium columnare]ANO49178.1 protease II [Flavobacterium columnare]APT22827.1 oligopeptidase B [Flavobacterium columnare]OOB84289.1 oligopeptidase B [Flavobacterium columnare]PDS23220.1 S9 family peptidase [Flavobacterium columnare] [Flavobacterium columnare NBRC 100251 = ATCC 23463]GEM58761.1 oligopeptidase B [Flavobacterium columnare NBRC 100251 = ATCC 23463]